MTLPRLAAVLAISGVLIGALWYLAGLVNRMKTGPAPTVPDDPDEVDDREESGADEVYGPELHAMAEQERELQTIAEEHGLDLLDPDDRAVAEDMLTLRLSIAELVDHFDGRVERILEDWQPGWWGEPSTPLPDFSAVHALVDDTSEFDRRELDALLAGAK